MSIKLNKMGLQYPCWCLKEINQELAIKNNRFYYNQLDVKFEKSLRGGGAICASNKVYDPQSELMINIPQGFDENINKHSWTIINQIPIQFTGSDILIAFQWFLHNEGYFWIISDCNRLVPLYYSLCLNTLVEFLSILPNYLNCSGYLFYLLLKICNYLMHVIVKYQFFNKQRFFDEEKKQALIIQIGNLENLIKIEINKIWETGVLFELSLLKTALTHLRTNSTQGRDFFIQFVAGLATSLASFKLSDELKDALKEGTKLLFIKFYEEQIQNPIEIYKIYQFFKGLKWKILFQLGKKSLVYQMIAQLKEGYNQNFKNSKNWIIHYCWVEMISELLIYRPKIQQDSLSPNQWNQLLLQKQILPLPYNKKEASVNISVRQLATNNNGLFSNVDNFEFVIFKELLLESSLSGKNEIQLWNQYLNFEFKNAKQNISGSQLEDLKNLISSNQTFLLSLIQRCKQGKINFVLLCQQKQKLLEWYEKNQMDSSKQILIHDLNLTFTQLEDALEYHLISINELLHYFLFYSEKIKFFLKILDSNLIKPQNISIEPQLNETLRLQQTTLEQLITSWQKILSQILIEQLNQVILGNSVSPEQLTEQSGSIVFFFDISIQNVETVNNNQLQIQRYCNKILDEFKDKFQIQNAIDLSQLIDSLYITQTVPILSRFVAKINSNSKQPPIESFSNFTFTNWKFDDLQGLQISYKEIVELCKNLKVLQLFLHIQNSKYYYFKQYLQSIMDDIDNSNINCFNSLQYHDEMSTILKEQKKYIQSILNIPNSFETKVIIKQIDNFEQQLSQIKYFINQKEFSESFKAKVLSFDVTISLKLKLLILFSEDWKNQKAYLIKEYDNFLYEIGRECQQQNQTEQKQSLLANSIDQIITQLSKKSCKVQKKQTSQLHKEWLIVQNYVSKIIQIEVNCCLEKQNIITKNSEMTLFVKQISLKTNQLFLSLENVIQQQNNKQSSKFQVSINLFTNYFDFFIQSVQQFQQNEQQTENEYENFLFQILQNEFNNTDNTKNIFSQMFENKSYRVRECLFFNLIKMQADSQDPSILKLVQMLLKQIWVYEKDQNFRVLLNNREMIQMQQKIFSFELKSFSDQLQQDMKDKTKEIEKLEQDARLEGESHKGEQFEILLKKKYDEFEQMFDNVSEMSDKIGLNLMFLKEIGKDIKIIKNKIDKLQDVVNTIGSDVRKLRGKNFQELLQLRMEKILQEKRLRELDSVYVEVKTKEIDSGTGQSIKSQNGLVISSLFKEAFDNYDGEINEYLWDEKEINKDIFLLKGQAGSGKSRAAKMIEEFVWEQSMISKQNKTKWIPIFISLPQLKDPKYNLFREGLQSENYQFDQFQIKEFLEAIQKDEIRILLILDSYDEMNSQHIESNLYQTNKFNQEFSIQVPGIKLKIVITVRTEILKQQTYQNLFYGTNLKNLKEVELLPFTSEQGSEYLMQFCTLNVKRQIKKLYDFARQARGLKFDIDEFLQIMKPIDKVLKQYGTLQIDSEIKDQELKNVSNKLENQQVQYIFSFQEQLSNMQSSAILNYFGTQTKIGQQSQNPQSFYDNQERLTEQQIEVILKNLRKYQLFDKMNDSAFLALQKDLTSIWSESRFSQTIHNIKISHLLQTPFMMEIVVQVLPLIVVIFSDREIVYKQFCENFMKLKKKIIIGNIMRKKYDSLLLDDNFINQDYLDEQVIAKNLSQILETLESYKFFQNYSLADQIMIKNNSLVFKKNSIPLNDLETADIIVKSLKMSKITVFDFYQTFVTFYSESQLQKWKNLGKVNNSESLLIDFQEFQESLALDMTLRQITQITYKSKGKLSIKKAQAITQNQESWEDQYFENFGEQNYYKILRSCILLTSNGNTYSFNHKSIQEFYVGKYILDILDKVEEKDNIEKVKNSLFNEKLFNLSQMQYSGTIRLIFDKLNQIPHIKEKLRLIINSSKNNQSFLKASSNCLFLCKSQKIYLMNENFENINIADINIEGLSFHNCDLSGSNFDNVAIDSCNFNLCNLQNIEWRNIIYNETKILKGHNKSVNLITFSQNNYLASTSNDGVIYLWNTEEATMIKSFDTKMKKIESMTFSHNGKYLAINTEEKIELWNTEEITMPVQNGLLILEVERVSFTYDDKILISFYGGQILNWDVEKIIQSYKPLVKIEIQQKQTVTAQSCSNDGKYLVVGFINGNLSVYSCQKNYQLITQLQQHKQRITVVSFYNNETIFITACKDQKINIWQIYPKEQIQIVNSIIYLCSDFFKILYHQIFQNLFILSDDLYIYQVNLKFQEPENQNNFEIETLNFTFEQIVSNKLSNCIAYLNKGNVIISQINNSLQSFEEIGTIGVNSDQLKCMTFSNKSFLALVFNKKIEIWSHLELQKKYEIKIVVQQNDYILLNFSQDEKQIIISQSNGLIEIFELSDTNKLIHSPKLMEGDNSFYQTNVLLYSHNNLYFLIGRYDGQFKIIEKVTYNEIIEISLKQHLVDIQFYFDDSHLIVGQKSQIDIVTFQSCMQTFNKSLLYVCESSLLGFTQLQEENALVAVFNNKIIFWTKLLNQNQSEQIQNNFYQIIYIWIYDITAFTILQQQCAIICKYISQEDEENFQEFYSLVKIKKTNKQIHLIEGHKNIIKDFANSNDNQYIVSVDQYESIIWNCENMNQVKSLKLGAYSVQFYKENKLVLDNLQFGIIVVDWKLQDIVYAVVYKMISFDDFRNQHYKSSIVLNEEKIIFSLKNQFFNEVYIWQTNDFKTFYQSYYTQSYHGLYQQSHLNIKSLEISFYNKEQDEIRVKSIQNNGIIKSIYNCKYMNDYVNDCIITEDGQLFLADQKSIKIYSADNQLINKYQFEEKSQLLKIQYLNKQHQLIILLQDQIQVLNYGEVINNQNKKEQPSLYHIFYFKEKLSQIIVNEKTQILISFSNLNILIWDISAKYTFPQITAHPLKINCITISADGKTFSTGSLDNNIKIWNIKSCQQLQGEESHQNIVDQMQFVNESLVLVSHGEDNTLRFWDVEQKSQIKNNNDIVKFCFHQKMVMIYTKGFQLLYSNFKLNQNYVYLELFKVIDLEDIEGNAKEFYLLKNGRLIVIFNEQGSLLYEITEKFTFKLKDNRYYEYYQNEFFNCKQKIILNMKESDSFLIFTDDKITITEPPTNCEGTTNYKYQHIAITQKIEEIIYNDNQIIVIFQNSKEIVIYENVSQYFKENKKVTLSMHDYPIITIQISQVNCLVSLDDDGKIIFWNLQVYECQRVFDLKESLQQYEKCLNIEFSCSGRMLATGHEKGRLIVWNIEEHQNIVEVYKFCVPKQEAVEKISFFPSDRIVACLSNEFIWFFQLSSKKENLIMRSTFKCQKYFAFVPNYPYILCINKDYLKAFNILDSFDFQNLKIDEEIGTRKFSQSSNFFVYSNQENQIKIFDLKNLRQLSNAQYDCIPQCILISHSEKIIVSLNENDQIECWVIQAIENMNRILLPPQLNKEITCVEITPDSKLLVFANKNLELFLFKIDTSEILLNLRNFNYQIKSVCFTQNLSFFALGFSDGTIKIYSFNHQYLDPISQLKDFNFQLNLKKEPMCIQIFGKTPELMAYGCKLNQSIILNQQNQSLLEVFKLKQLGNKIDLQ